MTRRVLYVIILLNFAFTSKAQESCTEKLYKANSLYELGQISEAIAIARLCTEFNNLKSDQWQAFRLLTMAYLLNGQAIEARASAIKMLNLNPIYKPSNLKDPIELIKLLNSIKIIPKFSIGITTTLGLNITKPRITGIYNGANYSKNYSTLQNWHTGFLFGYNFTEKISVQSGLIATSKNYKINYSFSKVSVNVDERLTYLNIPVSARLASPSYQNFRFVGDIGVYAGRLVSSQSDFTSTENNVTVLSSANLNSETRRQKWEYGFLAGGGIIYPFKKVNIVLDTKYFRSLSNITNSNYRYKNDDLFDGFYYVDDDLKLDNITFSLSFMFNMNYKVLK